MNFDLIWDLWKWEQDQVNVFSDMTSIHLDHVINQVLLLHVYMYLKPAAYK